MVYIINAAWHLIRNFYQNLNSYRSEFVFRSVIRTGAGKANFEVAISDSKGAAVTIQNQVLSYGNRVSYIPKTPGMYTIHITYGGLDVPGPFNFVHSFVQSSSASHNKICTSLDFRNYWLLRTYSLHQAHNIRKTEQSDLIGINLFYLN